LKLRKDYAERLRHVAVRWGITEFRTSHGVSANPSGGPGGENTKRSQDLQNRLGFDHGKWYKSGL